MVAEMNAKGIRTPILVIGKKDSERSQLVDVLSELGCEVIAAESVAEATSACRALDPGVVFVDCQMPHGSGTSIVDGLIAIGTVAATSQVVAYTSGSLVSCLDTPCTMSAVIRKPITREVILPLIEGSPGADVPGARTASVCDTEDRTCGRCPNGIAMQSLLRDFDKETARKLVQTFIDDCEVRLADIEKALQAVSWDKAMRQVHALKSGSLQIGAQAMVRSCDAMMSALRAENMALAEESFSALRLSFKDERASLQ